MPNNKLKKITTVAKQLYKSGKFAKWTDAIKAASKQISGTKTHKDTKSHNVNIRVVSGVKKKVGAVKIVQKGQSKNAKVTKVLQQVRTKAGTFKGYKKIGNIINAPNYSDAAAAREIEIYADSNSALYFSRKLPILKNLQRKFQKGTYKVDAAAKLWLYYINDAMQRYNKEFGSRGDKWHELLSVSDRKLLALEYAKETLQEFQLGNFVN